MSLRTVEERRAHVLRLKAEGLTYRQIAERIGLSRSHVSHLASERAYETQLRDSRERKRRRVGTCEDCGAVTRYAGGRRGVVISRRCLPCANARNGEARRGHGPAMERVLAFIGDGERRFSEITEGCGLSHGMTSVTLHRMRKHGLLERPRRGVYRKAGA